MKNKKLQKALFGGNPRRFGAVTKKEENEYYAAEKEKKETAAAKKKYVEKRYKEEKLGTRNLDAPVTGKSFPAAYKKYKAERDAENGKMKGGKIMKKKMMGYKAGGLQMVEKDGKKVPFYAADGKGKMMMGGKVMGYKEGKTVKKKPLFRKLSEKERLEKSGLPVTVRDSKTKETNKRKTAKMGQANRASGGAERKEDTLVGKAINRGMLGVAAMADIVRAASGTKKGAGPSSYMGPSIRAGVKAAKIKKERAGKMAGGMMKKKMMGGGKVMGYKKGGMPRGCGVATRQRPAKMIVMKGS